MSGVRGRSVQANPCQAAWSGYDRRATSVGIVHIGVGAFHRAHFAEYVDDVLAAGARDWAICGVGLLDEDKATLDALRAQDCIYTRVIKNADGTWTTRLIGSLAEVVSAPDDPQVVLDKMSDPAVRIVSMTITEGGYLIDDSTGDFSVDAPSIQNDLEPGSDPSTVFGYLVDALARRRSAGVAPFTVLSCDNLPHNGDALRKGVLAVAERRAPTMVDWIAEYVSFPNSMVDRITPGTSEGDRDRLRAEVGLEDQVPVVCEPFRQWVVEDRFDAGRPAFEEHGVQLVADVVPFENAKLRLLNGGHQAVAHVGFLLGYDHVHEACADPVVLNFLLGYLAEVQATLEQTPELDLHLYVRQLVARFTNPEIKDPVDRIRAYASDRVPKWVVPAISDNLMAGRKPVFGVVVLCAWRRSLGGALRPRGYRLVPDRRRDFLLDWVGEDVDPVRFVSDPDLFGDLAQDDTFLATYRETSMHMQENVIHTVLRVLQAELFPTHGHATSPVPA